MTSLLSHNRLARSTPLISAPRSSHREATSSPLLSFPRCTKSGESNAAFTNATERRCLYRCPTAPCFLLFPHVYTTHTRPLPHSHSLLSRAVVSSHAPTHPRTPTSSSRATIVLTTQNPFVFTHSVSLPAQTTHAYRPAEPSSPHHAQKKRRTPTHQDGSWGIRHHESRRARVVGGRRGCKSTRAAACGERGRDRWDTGDDGV